MGALAVAVAMGRMVRRRRVPVAMMPTRGAAAVEITLQAFNPGPVTLDNLLDMGDAVKINLELVQLLENLGVASNLSVGSPNDTVGFVVLQLRKALCFVAQVLYPLLDAGHEMVKVATQGRQRRAIKHQEALAAGAAGGA